MTSVRAQVIADSVSPDGHRLTTIEVTCHRFVLAELNTHRMFSRNSASSRAIPFRRQLNRVEQHPAIPVSWPYEQSGMQGGQEISNPEVAERIWLHARDDVVHHAKQLAELGVHKSVVNRMLEPWMWHTVIVSATEWGNFWDQRCSPLAQPEMRVAAEAMRDAFEASKHQFVDWSDWHLPYVTYEDRRQFDVETLKQISVARCARVSYLTHDGVRDIEADLRLYDRLVKARPPHASPLEHVARPSQIPSLGNFRGWDQLRHLVLGV